MDANTAVWLVIFAVFFVVVVVVSNRKGTNRKGKCPKCEEGLGFFYTPKREQRGEYTALTFSCENCGHSWEEYHHKPSGSDDSGPW
jgi:hypothetical protein